MRSAGQQLAVFLDTLDSCLSRLCRAQMIVVIAGSTHDAAIPGRPQNACSPDRLPTTPQLPAPGESACPCLHTCPCSLHLAHPGPIDPHSHAAHHSLLLQLPFLSRTRLHPPIPLCCPPLLLPLHLIACHAPSLPLPCIPTHLRHGRSSLQHRSSSGSACAPSASRFILIAARSHIIPTARSALPCRIPGTLFPGDTGVIS